MANENEEQVAYAGNMFHLGRLAVKPPPFWKPDPRLWFAQVEAQFLRAGITTDETKYYTIVAEIDSAILTHASDINANPPASGKYEVLKDRLLTEFGESTEKRLKRLFDSCDLNDKKPSALLREMKDLANNRLDQEVLKSIWLRRLPSQVQQILFNHLARLLGAKHIHTTSYHPQANGMVERWHRVLKAALRCHMADVNWVDILPVVLLGLRSAVKEELGVSVAEMLYGQPIRLPGEFLEDSAENAVDEHTFLQKVKYHFEKLRPTQTSQHGKAAVFVPKDLRFCSHVFLRDDTIHKPFKAPYDGPYLVVNRFPKTYTILIGTKQVTVSIDRLKPAYFPREDSLMVQDESATLQQLPRVLLGRE